MKKPKVLMIAAILMIFTVPAIIVSAQGTMQKRVNFWVNVPFVINEGEMVLPPGKYVLFQVKQNDLNLFGLFRDDLTSSPIAMIRTVRIDYTSRGYPGETEMLYEIDHEREQSYPVIDGWTIPGMDGWEIISVTGENHSMNSKPAISRSKNGKKVVITATSSGFDSRVK